MSRDNDIEAGVVHSAVAVNNENPDHAHFQHGSFRRHVQQAPAYVGVSTNRSNRGNAFKLLKDCSATDVTGMNYEMAAT